MPRKICVLLAFLAFSMPVLSGVCVADDASIATDIAQMKSDKEIEPYLNAHHSELSISLFKTLTDRGNDHETKAEYNQAILLFQAALQIAERLHENERIVDAINKLAYEYDLIGDLDQEKDYIARSLKSAQELKYQPGIADALLYKGNMEENSSQFSEAFETYQRSYEIYVSLKDENGTAMCLNNLGNVFNDQGQYEKAMGYYQQALDLWKKLGKPKDEARALNNIAGNYYSRGLFTEAIARFTEALHIFEQMGDKKRTAILYMNVGAVYGEEGDYLSALEHMQRAITKTKELGTQDHLNIMYLGLATVNKNLGNYEEALKYSRLGLELSKKTNDPLGVGDGLCHIASIYSEQGNYGAAANYAKQCLETRKASNLDSQADAIMEIGKIYMRDGNQELAQNYFKQALEQANKLNQRNVASSTLNLSGYSYFLTNNPQFSEKQYEDALADANSNNDKPLAASTLYNLAQLYESQGQLEKAVEAASRSLVIAQEMGDKSQQANALDGLARIYFRKGDFQQSLSKGNASTELSRQIHNPNTLWQSLTVVGKSQSKLNLPDDAKKSFDQAIALIDGLRLQTSGGEEEQQLFFENKLEPYDEMIGLLFERKQYADALSYAERAKARVLDDVIREGKLEVSKSMTSAEQDQEEKLTETLVSLNSQLRSQAAVKIPDAAKLAELNGLLEKSRADYEAFHTALYDAHPELKIQRAKTEPTSEGDIGKLLRTGDRFFEYAVTENATFLFVSQKDQQTRLHAYRIPIGRKDLAKKVEDFRVQLSKADPEFRAPAESLYALLIEPAESELTNGKELVLNPDRELWGLPFQALINTKGDYLLDQFAISYVPSLTVLRDMRERKQQSLPSQGTLLAFGNPQISAATMEAAGPAYRDQSLKPLPEAETEVKALQKLYGTSAAQIYVGAAASEETWKKEAGKYHILHFATHSILNSSSPMYSHVLLAQSAANSKEDGLLEAREILQMNLPADLVVLSACETALGHIGAGEGMIGLTWAFFVAGSKTALVSQWKVESASTEQLMLAFYKAMKNGASKPEALRTAARTLSKEYQHPFYWAGFVIIGDPQ